MHDTDTALNNARIKLEALLREQEALIEAEVRLTATRKTLAANKSDTEALKAQVKLALEESIRNKLLQQDTADKLEAARQAQAEAEAQSARAAKIATAKRISDKLQAISEAAKRADEGLSAYTAAIVEIKKTKRQINADLTSSFVTESWQQLPGDSVEAEARGSKNALDDLYRFHTELHDAREYSIVRNAVQSFISQAGEYIVGFAK